MNWQEKVVLITGGTGSFGRKFTEIMLNKYKPKVLRIFSRDEQKQAEMMLEFKNNPRLRFFIGDVRDSKRLERAIEGVDIVVHAAALKQVPLCEYNPFEAVHTNIIGAENVINAAIDCNVEKVIAIGTDKAVEPINLYGATKLCMEKLFIAANAYVGANRRTKMSCIRYGNFIGSRGSVIPLFKKQKETGVVTITDEKMTRFFISLEASVEFAIYCIENMQGGEIFVPKAYSIRIVDLAKMIASGCRFEFIGKRPGEKLSECLLTEDEAQRAVEFDKFFVIKPEEYPWWSGSENWNHGKKLSPNFSYRSDKNLTKSSKQKLQALVKN
jgi:UDP-N-acetylglucosamine 4,6-dehydratase